MIVIVKKGIKVTNRGVASKNVKATIEGKRGFVNRLYSKAASTIVKNISKKESKTKCLR